MYTAARSPSPDTLADTDTDTITDAERETGRESEKKTDVKAVGSYAFLGTHLKGVWNNPYIHGLDASPDGRTLHATWVYRDFVAYEGWDDPLDTKHKMQAGPNSAANNHDICHAWSSDGGTVWCARAGAEGGSEVVIADLRRDESILPTAPGIIAVAIPKGSGLTNQEAQAIDIDGGVHVLNRDHRDADGVLRWRHYYLAPGDRDTWVARAVPHVDGACGGSRGRLAVGRDGDLFFVLPHHADPVLTILRASRAARYADYELVWRAEGFPPTDPLVDKARLSYDNVLSVFTRAFNGSEGDGDGDGGVDVVVLDFQL